MCVRAKRHRRTIPPPSLHLLSPFLPSVLPFFPHSALTIYYRSSVPSNSSLSLSLVHAPIRSRVLLLLSPLPFSLLALVSLRDRVRSATRVKIARPNASGSLAIVADRERKKETTGRERKVRRARVRGGRIERAVEKEREEREGNVEGNGGKEGTRGLARTYTRQDRSPRSIAAIYTVKRESARSACSGLDPPRFRSRGANHAHRGSSLYFSLSFCLSLSVVPSSVLLSVSSFRLVTGWLGLVGQLVVSRAHVPFDERDSVRKRTTDQPRLSAMGGLRFSSRPSRVCLVVAFHGKGE